MPFLAGHAASANRGVRTTTTVPSQYGRELRKIGISCRETPDLTTHPPRSPAATRAAALRIAGPQTPLHTAELAGHRANVGSRGNGRYPLRSYVPGGTPTGLRGTGDALLGIAVLPGVAGGIAGRAPAGTANPAFIPIADYGPASHHRILGVRPPHKPQAVALTLQPAAGWMG